ncbi:MAG: hypothetical protein N3A65_04335 [candidate division WOR-3 bacterium]|nr:hypothetical protein [candidate division WOR-3 bacterium]
MGVWHLSGLGINPGAVTVPLTYVYLFLKQSLNDNKAKEFFRHSGETNEELPGKPEALIIFTSKAVISGEKKGDIEDRWFKTQQAKSAPETIKKYLTNLLENLENEKFNKFYGKNWIKYFYCVEVNHEDFDDCFKKIAVTINALKEKEIWINMIGGTNQINTALLSSAGFTSAAVKYYYFFQSNTRLLHPDIPKPDFNNLKLQVPPPSWHELPIFTLDMSKLYTTLQELFESRTKVHINEIKKELNRLNFPDQFFAKIRSTLLKIDGETATKGYMLDHWINIWKDLKNEFANLDNFSKWETWASDNKILNKIEPF